MTYKNLTEEQVKEIREKASNIISFDFSGDGTACARTSEGNYVIDPQAWMVDFFLQELDSHLGRAMEEKTKKIEQLKPILWNEDKDRHLENVAKYNTIDEVLAILNQTL